MAKIEEPIAVAVVEIDDGEKQFSKDEPTLIEKALPVSSLHDIITEFHCPEMDPDIEISVTIEISEDGGKTWYFNGGFARIAGGPWIDKDGNPTEICAGWHRREFADTKETVKIADGALIRTEVKISKGVAAGKLVHRVLTEEKK